MRFVFSKAKGKSCVADCSTSWEFLSAGIMCDGKKQKGTAVILVVLAMTRPTTHCCKTCYHR